MVVRRIFRGRPKPQKKSRSEVQLINERHLGPEPSFAVGQVPNFLEKARAFTWYNAMADDQDVRDYLEVGLKALGREDLVRDLKAAPDQVLPRTAAWICRMADRGADVAVSMDFVIKSASELAERYRGRIVEGADPVVRQGPTIQDRMDAKASDLIAELDGMIDRCEFEGFNFFLKLKSVDFPPQLASRIADHYAGLAAELAEAELGKDGDLKEAYKRFDKKNLHAYRDFVCGIVEDEIGRAHV